MPELVEGTANGTRFRCCATLATEWCGVGEATDRPWRRCASSRSWPCQRHGLSVTPHVSVGWDQQRRNKRARGTRSHWMNTGKRVPLARYITGGLALPPTLHVGLLKTAPSRSKGKKSYRFWVFCESCLNGSQCSLMTTRSRMRDGSEMLRAMLQTISQ